MRRIMLLSVLAFTAIFAFEDLHSVHATGSSKMGSPAYSPSAVNLQMDMRKLWEDHITYTRNYIISALGDLGDTQKVAERLLRNQDEIGSAIKPIYGEQAGKKLSALLRDHILVAADIVKAAKAEDTQGVANGQKRWHENADQIASFLTSANPNWSKQMMTEMLYKHLDFTTTEVVSRLKKDWAADIRAYDLGHEHMLMFADFLRVISLKATADSLTRSESSISPLFPLWGWFP